MKEHIDKVIKERAGLLKRLANSDGASAGAMSEPETQEARCALATGFVRPRDCHRIKCGAHELRTSPPMAPPVIVCDMTDCNRCTRAS